MNGIVSGKTVDELSAYGKIEKYTLTVALFKPWWKNTAVGYTSDKFCLPLSVDSAIIDDMFYESYKPFVTVYFTGGNNQPSKGFVVKLNANTSFSQSNRDSNLTVSGKVLILDEEYSSDDSSSFDFGLSKEYPVTF